LLHEICHHLDFTLFDLAATFHTTGFFRRESSLMRQLVGKGGRAASSRQESSEEPAQLDLFASDAARRAKRSTSM